MIRAALVGLGWWGRTIAGTLAESALIRPVLGIDPDATSRAAAAALVPETAAHFEDALARADIDALILATPHKFHAAQIVAAAAAGKHVFCEKPLCTTAADAERAIGAVEAAGVTLGIGHERRFEPAMMALLRRVAAGELGIPMAIEANFSQSLFLKLPLDNWRLSAVEAPIGPLSATGIHLIDLSIAVFGRPSEVWARLGTRATKFANGDTLTVTLGFPGGATALITAILATPFAGRFAVFGSEGWSEIRDRTHPEKPTGWDVTDVFADGASQTRFYPPHAIVRDNLEAFARAIDGTSPYPVTHADMRANVATFEAVGRSVASGQVEVV